MNIEHLLNRFWFFLLFLAITLFSITEKNGAIFTYRLRTALLPLIITYLIPLSIYLLIPYLPPQKKKDERSFKSWYQRGILINFLLWPLFSYLFFLILQKIVDAHYQLIGDQVQAIYFIPLKSTALLGFASLFIGFYLASWLQTIWLRFQLRANFFSYLDYLKTNHQINYWRTELISIIMITIVAGTTIFLSLSTYTRFNEDVIGISYLGRVGEEQFLYTDIESIEEYHLMRDSSYGIKYLSYFSVRFEDGSYWESSTVPTITLPEQDKILLSFMHEKSGRSITQIESIPNSKWERK